MAVHPLITALETHIKLLEEFFRLLNRETRELSDIQLDAMAEINDLKENLTTRLEKHSTVLRNEIETAAIQAELPPQASLGEVADAFLQRGEKNISRLHKEINRVAENAREAISVNREIAERFAASVTTSLELLTKVVSQSNTYGATGGYQQRPSGAVLINREA